MTFFDLRSSDSSEEASKPEQRRHVHSDDDVVWSSGSYIRPQPIPKKDKLVEEMKLQHEFEIKALRTEMERMRSEQRRLKDDVNCVRTHSSTSKPSRRLQIRGKGVAQRSIPAEIFYSLPPRHTSLHPDPLTISDSRTPKPADTTGHDEFRRNRSAGVANPTDMVTSTRFPLNNASVTTVLAYPSKSDAPIITTWKLTDIEAFEGYCKDSRIFQCPNDEAWRALRNVFPIRTMDLDITDVIQTLRGVAAGTDINAMYNPKIL